MMVFGAAVAFLLYRRTSGPLEIKGALTDPGSRHALAAGIGRSGTHLRYLTALSVAPVVVVLPVFQTTPLLVAGLSLLFMPHRLEQVTWRLDVAAAVVVVGATVVSLAAS